MRIEYFLFDADCVSKVNAFVCKAVDSRIALTMIVQDLIDNLFLQEQLLPISMQWSSSDRNTYIHI